MKDQENLPQVLTLPFPEQFFPRFVDSTGAGRSPNEYSVNGWYSGMDGIG